MKKTIFPVLALSMLASHCAAQGASLIPNTLPSGKQDDFRAITRTIDNPCVEEELQSYQNLEALLDDGKTCREAYILSDEIAFFLTQDVDHPRIYAMIKEEARGLADPKKFILENRPRLGSESAPAELVIFSDFQCPYCARAAKNMQKVYDARPDEVSVVFKQMPLTNIHQYAAAAALVSVFAHEKGKFWEVHDKFFENQKSLDADMITDTLETFGASQNDLFDPEKGQKYGVTVIEDMQDANKAGVEGTPAVYLNGVEISAAASFDRMISRIDAEISAPPAASEKARARAREKALQTCPYPGHEELYALLPPAGKADLAIYANSALCPCPKTAESLHACAAAKTCPAADSLIDTIITRIHEKVSKEDIASEIENAVRQERTKISP